MTNTPDKSEMKACPFCGDPMVREAGGFGHTADYQDALPEEKRCILRHTFYPYELIAAWNQRASSHQVPDMVERVVGKAWEQSIRQRLDEARRSSATTVEVTTLELSGLLAAALQAVPAVGETERLRDILDTERYKVAIGVQAIERAVQGRRWLSEPGRGSYTWDDERYQQEFGAALDEIEVALKPLSAIAQDWSDCPRDPLRVAANRDTALQAVPAASEVGWLTIESAPKDGTKVLLFTSYAGREDIGLEPFTDIQLGYWEDAANAPLRHEEAGWRKEFVGEPTHWRPLPEPPALKASGEE